MCYLYHAHCTTHLVCCYCWLLLLAQVAAQVDDGPCVMYIGDGGAGNFVKMVHNGIEYGDMQLISGGASNLLIQGHTKQ